MKNLFVYGDSYSSSELDQIGKSWSTMLSEKLEINLINRAVGGCSTHYQFLKLIEDFKSNAFEDNDIIIFGTGYPERYHFEHQRTEPSSAGIHSISHWTKKNRKYIDWYLYNLDYEYCHYNQGMIPHVLRSIAEYRPDLTIILTQVLKPMFMFPLKTPNNLLILDFQLHDISIAEFDGFDFPEWHGVAQVDLRVNHLCIDNNKILTDILEETCRTKEIKNNLEERFLKKVFVKPFKNLKDVKKAVEQGLIYYPTHINSETFSNFF